MPVVGKIVKAQGIKGDVKIDSYLDAPELFSNFKTILIDKTSYEVESVRPSGNMVFIKLKGVDTMNDAEKLRGGEIFVHREEMPSLENGRFYIEDLIGAKVYDDGGLVLGKVVSVLQHGSADVFVLSDRGKTVMFPFVGDVVESIDALTKLIRVNKIAFDAVAVHED